MQALSPTLQAPNIPARASVSGADIFARARHDLFNKSPVRDPKILEAAQTLQQGLAVEAERIVGKILAKRPRDPHALNIMAEIAKSRRDFRTAEACLARCVQIAPDHPAYRYNHACILLELGRIDAGLAEVDILEAKYPDNILFLNLKAAFLNKRRRYAESVACYRQLAARCPDSTDVMMGLALTLRSLGGQTEESISILRKITEFDPGCGAAWQSLASVKTVRFGEADIRSMEAQLAKPAIGAAERTDLYYALGKAYDDARQYEKAFQSYSRGNAIRRIDMDYDPDVTTGMVARMRVVYTPELFREREGAGCPSAEPIFVLGMQRSGSTLTEQILGAHSQIEPAGELQSMIRIVAEDVMPKSGADYPNGVDQLAPEDLKAFGEKYLKSVRPLLHENKPHFVDKNCYNLWQVGLIHLIFPNARIIDIRRHPISCCWANFSVAFSQAAPPLSYKLTDIGRFYHDYARVMAHFDRVLPGKVHRVIYERLVADLEGETRRMLDFLDLPFEQSCLEYYKHERSFNSISNEQVRRPIFKEGVERWLSYEPWLGPLKAALGPVLDAYPGVPDFPD
ncbi:MAG TPA: sulfotransferase [Rhizomicrobium sp.]|nr:sulfotransferase [Rhizomicrobium sp.]